MTEKILFRVPSSGMYLLACITVMQDYVKQRRRGRADVELTVQNPEPIHNYLLEAVPNVEKIDNECNPVGRGEYELVFDFDVERAYKLGKDCDCHVVTAFGHMVGASPLMLPDLKKIPHQEEPDNLVGYDCGELSDWNGMDKVAFSKLSTDVLSESTFKEASKCKIWAGHLSSISYVMAALGRPVIELYPDTLPKMWLSKWDADDYRMFYGRWSSGDVVKSLEMVCRYLKIPVSA